MRRQTRRQTRRMQRRRRRRRRHKVPHLALKSCQAIINHLACPGSLQVLPGMGKCREEEKGRVGAPRGHTHESDVPSAHRATLPAGFCSGARPLCRACPFLSVLGTSRNCPAILPLINLLPPSPVGLSTHCCASLLTDTSRGGSHTRCAGTFLLFCSHFINPIARSVLLFNSRGPSACFAAHAAVLLFPHAPSLSARTLLRLSSPLLPLAKASCLLSLQRLHQVKLSASPSCTFLRHQRASHGGITSAAAAG